MESRPVIITVAMNNSTAETHIMEENDQLNLEKQLARYLPDLIRIFEDTKRRTHQKTVVNRWIYGGVVVLVLATVLTLALFKIIDGATTGTIIGAIVGYTLGAVKEGFYD
jgi:hypothetical protein